MQGFYTFYWVCFSVASIGWDYGVGRPPKNMKKDFCHSGESVLDLTFIRMMWDIYLK